MILAALLAAVSLGQLVDCDGHGRCDRDRDRGFGGRGLAFFEFAPTSGAGMGAACACTTPTGAKGEALTFTRASSGTCLKGNTTSSIANGDMVTCSSNQARVMPGGDGTGGLGLLVEGARTSLCLRSQEIDNAVWAKGGTGVAAPVVTVDYAVAPDGTTTAERVQFAATDDTHTQSSVVAQDVATGTPASGAIFLKACEILYDGGCDPNPDGFNEDGGTAAGSFDIALYDGAAYQCATCSFVSTSWKRCTKENVTQSGVFPTLLFGNASLTAHCGSAAHPAADVFVWGGSYEAASYVSSYIATTSAAVTRATESANFPVSIANAVLSSGSAAATILAPGLSLAKAIISLDHTAGRPLYGVNAATNVGVWDGTNDVEIAYGTLSLTVPKRFSSDWSGSTMNLRNATDGTSTTGAFDGAMTAGTGLFLGSGAPFVPGNELFGVVKNVCVDPSPTRCR